MKTIFLPLSVEINQQPFLLGGEDEKCHYTCHYRTEAFYVDTDIGRVAMRKHTRALYTHTLMEKVSSITTGWPFVW